MREDKKHLSYYVIAAGLLVLTGVAVVYLIANYPVKPVNNSVDDRQIQTPANTDTSIPEQELGQDVNDPASVSAPEKKTSSSTIIFSEPIDNALRRITKKPFGIYVSPKSSPVSPEKFSGYHTGVDFEIFPGEEDTEIQASAICDGELIEKRRASGYGDIGIQNCKFGEEYFTVVYGHLKLSSIEASAGGVMRVGERIGILGKGFSAETDGERKHLHISISKGRTINIKGYVRAKKDLENWIDLSEYLK